MRERHLVNWCISCILNPVLNANPRSNSIWPTTSSGNIRQPQRRPTAFTQYLQSLVRGGGAPRVKAGPQSSKTSHLSLSRRVAQIWGRNIQACPPFCVPLICRRSWIRFLRCSIGGRRSPLRRRVNVRDFFSSERMLLILTQTPPSPPPPPPSRPAPNPRRPAAQVGQTRGRHPCPPMPTRTSTLRPAANRLVASSARPPPWLRPRRTRTRTTMGKVRPPRGRRERLSPAVYVFNPRLPLPSSADALETTPTVRRVRTRRMNCG